MSVPVGHPVRALNLRRRAKFTSLIAAGRDVTRRACAVACPANCDVGRLQRRSVDLPGRDRPTAGGV